MLLNIYIRERQSSKKQECIPVGCVPPAAVDITGGLHAPPGADPPGRHPPPEQAPPRPDPPQLPPWMWAWTRSPSTPPLDVGLGLETCKACHAGIPPPLETWCKACWDTTTPPPVNRITDACENITLPQLRCRP